MAPRRLLPVPGGMKAAVPALIASPSLCSRSRRLCPADAGDLLVRVEAFIYTIADATVSVEPASRSRGGAPGLLALTHVACEAAACLPARGGALARAAACEAPAVAADGGSKEAVEDWFFGIINSMETVFKEKMPGLDSLLEYNEIVRKMFGNEEEGFQFYNNYAKEKGFSVRRSYCEWDNSHNEMTLRKFVCSREGFREEKELKRETKKRKPWNITRVGCRAKLVIARDQNTGQWYAKDFIDGHNHPMAEPDVACLLRSHRRISEDQKAEILEMQISGIRKHQIMDIMEKQYGGYDKVGYTIRDLYNFCHRNKVETVATGDAQTVISYLIECKRRDPEVFFQYTTDGEGHLKGLLWYDCQCRLDYAAFGDVVVFDSTYKTNRYNLPLVPFVGVNHHGPGTMTPGTR